MPTVGYFPPDVRMHTPLFKRGIYSPLGGLYTLGRLLPQAVSMDTPFFRALLSQRQAV
jgi:hypothetical protein